MIAIMSMPLLLLDMNKMWNGMEYGLANRLKGTSFKTYFAIETHYIAAKRINLKQASKLVLKPPFNPWILNKAPAF